MKRVLMMDHAVVNREDRATAFLASRGHAIRWCSPAQGDALPPSGEHDALVVYGGAENLSTDLHGAEHPHLGRELDYIERWLASGRPYLGICLGSQLMAAALGARVAPRPDGLYELGFVEIAPTAAAGDFLPAPLHVYHWHQEGFELPAGAVQLATGPVFPNQAMRYGSAAYGLQFHPEVTPPVFRRWLDSMPEATQRPGAQPRDKQLADAARYDAAMGRWFEGFLERWIGP